MRAYRLIAKLCAVILLLIVSLGILGVSQMIAISDTNSEYTRVVREEVARMQALRSLTAGFFQVNRLCLNALIESDGTAFKTSEEYAARQLADLASAMDLLGDSSSADAREFQEFKALAESYRADVAAFFKLLEEDREADAKEFRLQRLRPEIEQINYLLGEAASSSNASVTSRIQAMTRSSEKLGVTGLIFSLWPFLVITIALAWTAIVSLRYLASADLSSEIPVR